MIESLEGVKNLNEIIKVKGIDAVLIGPYDLSASMKLLGKFSSKKFTSVIDNILSECRKSKIPCGLHIVDADKNNLLKKIKKGFKFLAYGMDTEILKNYYKYPLNF
jgi:2-dehydro-3-deoxyglucarate aldolase